jgi:hypothetical protein
LTPEDAEVPEAELSYMLVHQIALQLAGVVQLACSTSTASAVWRCFAVDPACRA